MTRTLLLIAAIDNGGHLAEMLSAAAIVQGVSVTEEAVGPAVAAGLVHVNDMNLWFYHPLVRSAICQGADMARRHAAHAALATVLAHQLDRVVWHQAAAVIGPDEAVALDLEALAERAQLRGAIPVAVAELDRAAQLTPDSARRGDRLLRAIELAFGLGHSDIINQLLREVETVERIPLPAIAPAT
jgi:hypothetical protein